VQETKDIKQEVEGYVGNVSEIKDDPERVCKDIVKISVD